MRRLAGQVDEQRHPRTNATLDQLLDRYLQTLDVGPSTRRMYAKYLEKRVRPFVGRLKAGAVDAEVLDSLYAELRHCRDHCRDRRGVDHRTLREHECDERCRPHACRPLSCTTIRHVHFVLRGAYEKGVRWRWVSVNPVLEASPPPLKKPEPRPPTPEDAAASSRPRGLRTRTGGRLVDGRERFEKDTKTHQQRRVALDPETSALLRDHRERCGERAAALGLSLARDAFVFSLAPDGSEHLVPASVSQRYHRLATSLGITTHLHGLRHYSATELIAAGVDVRTVAGGLGHSGGGTTTLRIYAAWLAEADQRAAAGLLARMPVRPTLTTTRTQAAMANPRTPRERLAAELREQILNGSIPAGGLLPGIKQLARERGVSVSTVHRAFALLREWGLVEGARGDRPRVLAVVEPSRDHVNKREPTAEEATSVLPAAAAAELLDVVLRLGGETVTRFSTVADPRNGHELEHVLVSAVRRRGGDEGRLDEYELELRRPGEDVPITTFVVSRRGGSAA